MRKIYMLLFVMVLPFAGLFADENELHISGMVFENPNANPVPGYMVSIEIPPNNMWEGYSNEVFTNEEGFYVDEIILPENISQGEVHLSTTSCNGEIITEMFFFSPNMMAIEHNFIICDEPYPDCQASFFWEPAGFTTIQFYNTSMPEDANCIWEFGDGVTSTEPNPQHAYAEAGVYEVCLMIYSDDLNCEDQICHEVWVGNNNNCEAFFEWGPAPDNPMVIAFFNLSFGGELEYVWQFGDGETSNEMNPVHDYVEPGVYEVCLEIYGEGCEDTFCTEVEATNGQFECMASFEWQMLEGLNVQFFNTSFPENVFTVWDFGDNQGSEEPNPVHEYAEPGVYEVCLLIYNDEMNCEDVFCTEVFIGNNTNCEAYFNWQPSDIPMAIMFFNESYGGEDLEYFWDFGDGQTSDEENPVHQYDEPGVYPVCLEINGENCADDYCTEVFVDEWPNECMAEFEFEVNEDFTVQFFNFSFPPESNYLWDFGDGETSEEFEPIHTYAEPGDYIVCLTIWNNEFNCEDVMYKEVLFGGGGGECEAYYTWWPTDEPLTIQFMDYSWIENGQYHWEFGDGTTAFEPNPTHSYEQPGIYEVCLVVYNDGCEDVYCEAVVVEGNGGGGDCVAEFDWVQLEGNQIQFFNNSQPQQAEFYWEFGDGNGYYEHSPVHLFDEPGVYQVCLSMITADGCAHAICHEVVVEGNGGGELTASFEMEWDNASPLTLQFWDTSTGWPTGWLWDFGDGSTSEEQNPSHTFEQGGTYTVCLTVFSANGISDTFCTQIEISEAYFSGIGDHAFGAINVFPNPVQYTVNIDMNLIESREIKVKVFNTLMQEVAQSNLGQISAGEQTITVQVGHLENGIYILAIKSKQGMITQKIIISK